MVGCEAKGRKFMLKIPVFLNESLVNIARFRNSGERVIDYLIGTVACIRSVWWASSLRTDGGSSITTIILLREESGGNPGGV